MSLATLLIDEHRALTAAGDDIVRALKRRPRIALDELARLRARFATLAHQHRIDEEALIFRPLKAAGLLDQLPDVRELGRDMGLEWAIYSDNIREWTPRTILADWDGYTAVMEARIALLKKWSRIEEEHVYPPALALQERAGLLTPPGRDERRAG